MASRIAIDIVCRFRSIFVRKTEIGMYVLTEHLKGASVLSER